MTAQLTISHGQCTGRGKALGFLGFCVSWFHRLAGVLFLLAASNAYAWGQYGHVVICQIAYASVSDSVRARIDALNAVHGEYASFNEACQWADRRPRKRSTRARALVFLGHWVGDVHQPLHVSFADDRGGTA